MTKALRMFVSVCVCMHLCTSVSYHRHKVAHPADPPPMGDYPWCSAVLLCASGRWPHSGRPGLSMADAMRPGMLLKVWFSLSELAGSPHNNWEAAAMDGFLSLPFSLSFFLYLSLSMFLISLAPPFLCPSSLYHFLYLFLSHSLPLSIAFSTSISFLSLLSLILLNLLLYNSLFLFLVLTF